LYVSGASAKTRFMSRRTAASPFSFALELSPKGWVWKARFTPMSRALRLMTSLYGLRVATARSRSAA
jgi:hypothetical protein